MIALTPDMLRSHNAGQFGKLVYATVRRFSIAVLSANYRIAGVLALLTLSTQTNAAFSCGINGGLPSVAALYVQEGQLRAIVGPIVFVPDRGEFVGKQLALNDNGAWKLLDEVIVPRRQESLYSEECLAAPVDEAWIMDYKGIPELGKNFQQNIGACASDGESEWGGISFYGAEGSWGVGGLVRKDIASGRISYHRPSQLTYESISHIAAFAGNIWIGTAHFGECGSQGVASGIRRFRPDYRITGALSVAEICGFAVNDFVEHDDALWVATELGIARLEKTDKAHEWQNYVPDLSAPELMRPVSCNELYDEILRSDGLAAANATDSGEAFDAFWRRLSQLRPGFISQHLRKLHGH